MIEQAKAWLSGKKSTGAGIGLIAIGVASLLGWVELDPKQLEAAMGIIGGLGLIALRVAVAKATAAVGTEGGLLSSAVQAVAEQVGAPDEPEKGSDEDTSPGSGA